MLCGCNCCFSLPVCGPFCKQGSLNTVSPHPQAPSWAFIMSALGLFIYQSLDAIDGKQARRTNSSSALGELFDHGCDAVSTGALHLNSNCRSLLVQSVKNQLQCFSGPGRASVISFCWSVFPLSVFVAVGTCISCGIGRYPNWMFFCGFIGMFMFFCAHWQTYVSGTLRFGL